jgi:flavin reductase (DIM6/NTAB) family NADH-FMN oxidoreductase RutF
MDGGPAMTSDRFQPQDHPRLFRAALGQFPTGVTVITTLGPAGPVGITANSFASVSLDPPLVLWSPARASSRFAIFAEAEVFAIHILALTQRPMAEAFTRAREGFPATGWQTGPAGLPLIDDVPVTLVCTAEARHPGGDHLILLGRVTQVIRGPAAAPLVFHAGQYGAVSEG